MDLEATPGQVPYTAASNVLSGNVNGALHSELNNTPGGYQPFVPTPSGAAVQRFHVKACIHCMSMRMQRGDA